MYDGMTIARLSLAGKRGEHWIYFIYPDWASYVDRLVTKWHATELLDIDSFEWLRSEYGHQN